MKAVILAGGEGTRMRPLTQNLHKAMLPLLNRPLMEYVLAYLREQGIREVIFALNYRPKDIQNYFGDGKSFGLSINYVLEVIPLGTAGAVKNVSRYLDDKPFCVLNGDLFYKPDLRRMLENHLQKKAAVSISVTRVENSRAYGLVKVDSEGRVQEFVEKPSGDKVESGLINAGIYILSPQVLELVPDSNPYMFEKGLFPELIRHGENVYGFPTNSYWIDVGTPENYMKIHRDLLLSKDFERGQLEQEALLWKKEACDIHPEAHLIGPMVLGEGCLIGPGAAIIGPVSMGKNCRAGNNATIEGSIIWQEAIIGERAALRNCIIGSGSIIGKGAFIDDGCIVGDNAQIPEGKVLPPGSKISV